MDTFTSIWRRAQVRCPSVDPNMLQDILRDKFNQLAERRLWSWRRKQASFLPRSFNVSGDTVSIVYGQVLVISNTGAFTLDMQGAQLRVGGAVYATYTISTYLSPTQALIDQPWGANTVTAQPYQVFQCFFTTPDDFQSFYSVLVPQSNYRMWTDIPQTFLNRIDAQRSQTGISCLASFLDYSKSYNGTVDPVLPINNASALAPISTTSIGFTFGSGLTFVILINNTAAPGGGLQFQWWLAQSPLATTSVTVLDSNVIDLAYGVQVYFPAGTYTSGAYFTINATPGTVSGPPRYELWPRPSGSAFIPYPYTYIAKLPDLSNDSPNLPPPIASRGDVLLEMLLADCATWPGTETQRNSYYNLQLAIGHSTRAEVMINEMELRDDNTAIDDFRMKEMDMFPAPWLDGAWLQTHDYGFGG